MTSFERINIVILFRLARIVGRLFMCVWVSIANWLIFTTSKNHSWNAHRLDVVVAAAAATTTACNNTKMKRTDKKLHQQTIGTNKMVEFNTFEREQWLSALIHSVLNKYSHSWGVSYLLFSLSDFPENWLIHSVLLLLLTHSAIILLHLVICWNSPQTRKISWIHVKMPLCVHVALANCWIYFFWPSSFVLRLESLPEKMVCCVSRSSNRLNHIVKSFWTNPSHKPSM